ncbi:hypothetical protein M8C21_031649 [Ambrosia artemisiifolia]|uniref:K-box domain-containing protein n=1 Tax=Ambrosia artemisiifolia TaxID=4212 RepID=A0AAD5GR71_AMBAR|nr:hypothetical protein M8C21_031649 [Ambrosia artemisiifolia]
MSHLEVAALIPKTTMNVKHRHLLREDLGPLSVKALHNLEKQLEGALIQARQRKTQILVEQMEELRRKERELGDINKHLRIKVSHEMSTLTETEGQGYRAQLPCPWNSGVSPGNKLQQHIPNAPISFQSHGLYSQFMQEEGPSVQRNMVGEGSSMHGWVNL